MKAKLVVLWFGILILLLLLPKVIKFFEPKIEYRDRWRVKEVQVVKEVPVEKIVEKEVVKQVEVPVFKGEKIIEKIVYQTIQNEFFKITKMDEDSYVIDIQDNSFPNAIWEVSIANQSNGQSKGLYLHRKRYSMVNSNMVSASTVGLNGSWW